ncbi:MAG: 4Fe-4S binding protein [Thermodesulfobacteriota bacterium]
MNVDESKCWKDGICVAECPMAIIKPRDGDGFPVMIDVKLQSLRRAFLHVHSNPAFSVSRLSLLSAKLHALELSPDN